ncbi:MAG: PQQ-binding-like beta-propeller repeat protein, partial [Gemmataceae bacterium]|nr:PQQ-binding-like beta-propeller repeat protein [Gemmataceae bacterium]
MSIVAECPNCQSRVTLPDEAAGRKARCPNPGCRRVFVAEAVRAKKPARPPADDPVLPYIPPDPADAPEAEVVEEVAEAVEVAEPGPGAAREVVWSPDADLPGGPPRAPREGRRPSRSKAAREPEPEEDDEPITRIRRKKKKKNRSAVILIGMLSALALAIGAAVFFSVKRSEDTETAEAEKAKTAYDKQDYAQSGKLYGELATKYAEREKAEEYRFFADLSEVQKSVRSVSNRENPRPALEKLTGFVGGVGKKPLAKPDQFGHDIFDAGRKLAEDLSGYAKDRVETFGKDRTKTAELQQAEEVIAAGEKLLPTLEPFRPRSLAPADAVEKEFKAISATIAAERHRLAVVGRLKELLADPTDAAITAAKLEAAANGLARDAEVEGLIRGAEAGFLARVGYAPEAAERQQPAAAGTPSYIFVSPVGARGKDPAPAAGGPDGGAVFLAVARGLLYALDETGEQLWAVRVGPGVYYPPAVARAEGAEGPVELAVVAGDVAGQPAVSGYDIRTGQGKWRQPLPAAAAGPAAVIGNRAFLPLRDDRGTVVVLDLAAGTKLGVIRLGQPVGPVVARPGTSLLYVAGESRRVFVFDVDATDAQGSRPRCVRVLQTDHPAGTLRTAPVFLGPEGDDPSAAGKRWLLLSQSDGPAAMRLRAFPITTAPPAAAGAPLVPEVVKPEVDLAVPGWAWFPPAGDGERLAVLTDQPHPDTTRQDRGQLRLFGVNQPGSQDNPVYPLPSPTLPEPPEGTPLPGLVIPAEDAAFWVLANGTLQKYRLSILPDRGLVAAGSGPAYPIGVPTQPAQFTPRRDAACFVVRGGGGARAVLVGLAD